MNLFHAALLIEDEASIAAGLAIALKKLAIPFEAVTTLAQARALLEERDFDLILLDRMLPDGEGLDLCAELRRHEYLGTILCLTAKGEVDDRVGGLNQGADDYLPKPFSWEELEARIRALARTRRHALLEFQAPKNPEGWEVEETRLRIKAPNKEWAVLTPLEFKLATKLMRAQGDIVSRDELLKDVWGFTLLPKTRTVDHFLGRLRKHLEQNPEEPKHFLTVRGAGYRFERG